MIHIAYTHCNVTLYEMEHFVIIVNGWKPSTIITKSSILNGEAVLDPSLKLPSCVKELYGHLLKYSCTHLAKQNILTQ